jgi:hypothetical protein
MFLINSLLKEEMTVSVIVDTNSILTRLTIREYAGRKMSASLSFVTVI